MRRRGEVDRRAQRAPGLTRHRLKRSAYFGPSVLADCLCLVNMRVDPLLNVGHHDFFVDIVEQIVVMALVELQRLVGCAGLVVEFLTSAGLGDLVLGAMEDEHGDRDPSKPAVLQSLVAAQHRRERLGWLHLVADKWVVF